MPVVCVSGYKKKLCSSNGTFVAYGQIGGLVVTYGVWYYAYIYYRAFSSFCAHERPVHSRDYVTSSSSPCLLARSAAGRVAVHCVAWATQAGH